MQVAAYINGSLADQSSALTAEDLFKRYFPLLTGFAARLIADKQAAQDMAVDILIKYWQRRDDFASEEKVKAFLYLSLKNTCLNYLKKRKRQEQIRQEYKQTAGDSENDFLHDIIRAEVINQIVEISKKQLPPCCRRIVYLHYGKGLTYEEVADILNISVHTVRNQVATGIRKLREQRHLLSA